MTAHGDKKLLILSDGRPGHVNQSIAFARHLGYGYDLVPVQIGRIAKSLGYLLDRIGVYHPSLFVADVPDALYAAVVSTGSATYYANKTLARTLGVKSVAIMLPKGYRYDFDLIGAAEYPHLAGESELSPTARRGRKRAAAERCADRRR